MRDHARMADIVDYRRSTEIFDAVSLDKPSERLPSEPVQYVETPYRGSLAPWDSRHGLRLAVSRAKHRLYVIGDHEDWQRRRHFSRLAAAIPPATNRA